jgi:DNA-binding transcriptional regulator GbsR (MarR family)
MEYNTTTGKCFMSDDAFADAFGVSKSTISREMKVLEDKGFITRETTNIKGGKKRYITINVNKIEEVLTNLKMSVDGGIQTSNCLLSNVNLPIDNKQNESIKDNIKEKRKDNNEVKQSQAIVITSLADAPKVEAIREVMNNSTDTNGSFKF